MTEHGRPVAALVPPSRQADPLAALGVVVTPPSLDLASLGAVPAGEAGEATLSELLAAERQADRGR